MAAGAPVGDRDLFIFHRALCSAAIFAHIGTAIELAHPRHYPGTSIVHTIRHSQARSLVRILRARRVALSGFVRRERREKAPSPRRRDYGAYPGLCPQGGTLPISA